MTWYNIPNRTGSSGLKLVSIQTGFLHNPGWMISLLIGQCSVVIVYPGLLSRPRRCHSTGFCRATSYQIGFPVNWDIRKLTASRFKKSEECRSLLERWNRQLRKNADPLFIDEIDSLSRLRSRNNWGQNDSSSQPTWSNYVKNWRLGGANSSSHNQKKTRQIVQLSCPKRELPRREIL